MGLHGLLPAIGESGNRFCLHFIVQTNLYMCDGLERRVLKEKDPVYVTEMYQYAH